MRYVVVNAFAGGNRRPVQFARWLGDLDYDRALISEADSRQLRAALRTEAQGYVYTGRRSHGAREVAVVTRRGRVAAGRARRRSVPLTDFVSKPFAHERYATRVRIATEVTYSLHANAVIQQPHSGLWTMNPGAVAWRTAGYPRLARRLAKDLARGLDVTAGGDMNADTGPPGGPDPMRFFGPLGLRTLHAGFMWFAYDPRRYELQDWQVLPTPPGADAHRVLVVDLTRRFTGR